MYRLLRFHDSFMWKRLSILKHGNKKSSKTIIFHATNLPVFTLQWSTNYGTLKSRRDVYSQKCEKILWTVLMAFGLTGMIRRSYWGDFVFGTVEENSPWSWKVCWVAIWKSFKRTILQFMRTLSSRITFHLTSCMLSWSKSLGTC